MQGQPQDSGPYVLVVDDDPLTLKSVGIILRGARLRVGDVGRGAAEGRPHVGEEPVELMRVDRDGRDDRVARLLEAEAQLVGQLGGPRGAGGEEALLDAGAVE